MIFCLIKSRANCSGLTQLFWNPTLIFFSNVLQIVCRRIIQKNKTKIWRVWISDSDVANKWLVCLSFLWCFWQNEKKYFTHIPGLRAYCSNIYIVIQGQFAKQIQQIRLYFLYLWSTQCHRCGFTNFHHRCFSTKPISFLWSQSLGVSNLTMDSNDFWNRIRIFICILKSDY